MKIAAAATAAAAVGAGAWWRSEKEGRGQTQTGGAGGGTFKHLEGDPTPSNYNWRMTVMLAFDEYLHEEGSWNGNSYGPLLKEAQRRIIETDMFNPIPEPMKGTYTSIINTVKVLSSKNSKEIMAYVNSMDGSWILVLGGMKKHAIGYLMRTDGANKVIVAIHNAGLGTEHHGLNTADTLSYPETAGIAVFNPVTRDRAEKFLELAGVAWGDGKGVEYASALYRGALAPLMISGGETDNYGEHALKEVTFWDNLDQVNGTFSMKWTKLRDHPSVSNVIMLPMQTTGDCALRALFFTPLAAFVQTNDPKIKMIDAWFLLWYAGAVNNATAALLSRKTDLLFTQAEFVAMHVRLHRLSNYVTARTRPGELLLKSLKSINATIDACREGCNEWYTGVLNSAESWTLENIQNKPTQLPDGRSCMDTQNKAVVFQIKPPEPYDLIAAVNDYSQMTEWGALCDKVMERKDVDRLSRAELHAITIAIYRLLLTNLTPPLEKVVNMAFLIAEKPLDGRRLHDAFLLWGMLYIAMRKVIPSDYAHLVKTFGDPGPFEMSRFDSPVYSRIHSHLIEFVLSRLCILKVLNNGKESAPPAKGLHDKYWNEQKWPDDGMVYIAMGADTPDKGTTEQKCFNVFIRLSSAFTYYSYTLQGIYVLKTIGPGPTQFTYRTPVLERRTNEDVADLFNPFKRSVEALFSMTAGTEDEAPSNFDDLTRPSHFIFKHGVRESEPEKQVVRTNSLTVIHHDVKADPIVEIDTSSTKLGSAAHLPSSDVSLNVVKTWAARLAHPKWLQMKTKEEWNATASAALYLACQYTDEDKELHGVREAFMPLLKLRYCDCVVRAMIRLLPISHTDGNAQEPSTKDSDEQLWRYVMIGYLNDISCDKRLHLRTYRFRYSGNPLQSLPRPDEYYMMNDKNEVQHLIDSADAPKIPVDFPLYDILLSQICFDTISRWKSTETSIAQNVLLYEKTVNPEFSIYKSRKYDVDDDTYEYDVEPSTGTPTKDITYSAKCQLDTYFGTTLQGKVGTYSFSEKLYWPVVSTKLKFKMVERNSGTLSINILEPVLPHPYFQSEFEWTPVEGKAGEFFGVPSSTSPLKVNNYCLVYKKTGDTRTVTQAPAPKTANCLHSTLLSPASPGLLYVPLSELLPTNNSPPGGKTIIRNLCARLLLFVYSDTILVWRDDTNKSHRIDLRFQGITFIVDDATGEVRTQQGVLLLLSTLESSHDARFWVHRMPSVFWATDNGSPCVLVLAVQRKDPRSVRSSNLVGAFFPEQVIADYSQHPFYPDELRNERSYNSLSDSGFATLKVHHKCEQILLPDSAESLLVFRKVSEYFGRTDVSGELDRMLSLLDEEQEVEATSNFPRFSIEIFKQRKSESQVASEYVPIRFSMTRIPLLRKDYMAVHGIARMPGGEIEGTEPGESFSTFVPPAPSAKTNTTTPPILLVTRGIDLARHTNPLRSVMKTAYSDDIVEKFEFVTGKKPRPDQIKVIDGILNEYNEAKKHVIRSLIMGIGKTAVVTPMVVMKSVVCRDESPDDLAKLLKERKSVVVITPDKLVRQTWQLMIPLILYMDLVVKEIRDYTTKIDEKDAAAMYLMSDTMAKRRIIDECKYPDGFRFLLDEADMMMNPLTSELNIPISPTTIGDMVVSAYGDEGDVVKALLDTLFEALGESEKAQASQDRLIKHTKLHAHVTEVIKQIKQREHKLHYGHLNTPAAVQRAVDVLSTHRRSDLLTIDTSKTDLLPKSYGKNSTTADLHAALEKIVTSHHDRDVVAVPYSFANSPSEGSEFADPILAIGYTIASLLATGLNAARIDVITRKVSRNDRITHTVVYDYMVKSGYMGASNRWEWILQEQNEINGGINRLAFIRAYVFEFVPRKVSVFEMTKSACGLDLVMSKVHPLRSGFTGTAEDITLVDFVPMTVKMPAAAADGNESGEVRAMRKLTYQSEVDPTELLKHIFSTAYDVIIDVGAVTIGHSHSDILCELIKTRPDGKKLQLAFWDSLDMPRRIDASGTVVPWDRRQSDGQIVLYDHAHTTGTDATLFNPNACITVRGDTTYRDFIQGLFRLRTIVQAGTKCAVVGAPTDVTDFDSLNAWLLKNSKSDENQAKPLRAMHNAMALVRSTPVTSVTRIVPFRDLRSALIETFRDVRSAYSVDYLRPMISNEKVPSDYNSYITETFRAAVDGTTDYGTISIALVDSLVDTIETALPNANLQMHVQAEAEAEAQAEAEAEKEGEAEAEKEKQFNMIPANADFPSWDFNILYSTLEVGGTFFKYDDVFYSNKFKAYPAGLVGHFRAMTITVFKTDTETSQYFVLTFPEALLLMDHLHTHAIPDDIRIVISMGVHKWYDTSGTAAQPLLTAEVMKDGLRIGVVEITSEVSKYDDSQLQSMSVKMTEEIRKGLDQGNITVVLSHSPKSP